MTNDTPGAAEAKMLVRYEVQGGIATLTLDAPPANTYSYDMMRQLDAAILDARMDDDVHVIVLRGAGEKFFCAGADIGMLGDVTPRFKYFFCLHANETLGRLEQTPKLTIAALNGHTVGGGLEVTMACDLRIAREGGGKLGLPEVNLGVLPGTGGTQRLARLVGRNKALELMIRGDNFTFEEGRDLGIVNEVLPGDFDAAIREYAGQFVPPNKAAKAVGAIKRAVCAGAEVPLESGLMIERELQQQLFQSDDAREGIAAFNEKRKAEFQGR